MNITLTTEDIAAAHASGLRFLTMTMREIVISLLDEASTHNEGFAWEIGEKVYPEFDLKPEMERAALYGALVAPTLVQAVDAVLGHLGFEPEYRPGARRFDGDFVDATFVAEQAAGGAFVELMQMKTGVPIAL